MQVLLSLFFFDLDWRAVAPSPSLFILLQALPFNWLLIVTWFATVNELFHRATVSAFLPPTPGRLFVVKRSQVQDVRQQQHFWLISNPAFISLPEAGAVKFPVSLGQCGDVFVFIHQLVWPLSCLSPGDSTCRDECERKIWTFERKGKEETRHQMSLWKTPLPYFLHSSPYASCECHLINHTVILVN